MNILLISPNTLTEPYPVYPLGLDYVAGALEADHQVKIVDMNVNPGMKSLDSAITSFMPDIIGISCRNIDNADAANPVAFTGQYRELASHLKGLTGALIVLGGSGFTILPEVFLEETGADFGIIGEGERFAGFVEAMRINKPVAGLPGVVARGQAPQVPPPWNGRFSRALTVDLSHARYYLDRGGMLNLQTKRGCPFRCIYCPYPHIEGRALRLFSPGNVAETALSLQDRGARYLFITDSAFNSDVSHSLAVAEAFQKAGVSIPWGAFFAPVKLPDDYFKIMAGAGLTHVEFGTESLSDPVLSSYGKPFRRAEVLNAHARAVQAGLHVAHYFLLGGPGETSDTVLDTLDHMERLEKAVFFLFTGLRIYPNTKLYELAMDEGRISALTGMMEPVFYRNSAVGLDSIERLVKGRARGRVNWVAGSGAGRAGAIVEKMHSRGYTGPLWEYMVR